MHDDVIKWKHFPRYWPFVRESTGHRSIPLTKASEAELWGFPWSRRRWFETASLPLWRHSNGVLPINLHADGLGSLGARTSAGTLMIEFGYPTFILKAQSLNTCKKNTVTLEAELSRMSSECEFLEKFSKFELHSETTDHILTAFQIFVTIIHTVPNVLYNLKARSTGFRSIPNIRSILTVFETCWSLWKYNQSDITFSNAAWCRHQMETFSALLTICAGNPPATVEFPAQRPVRRSFDVFFYLRLNKLLSKQSWGWWFETPSRSSWRHCNDAPQSDRNTSGMHLDCDSEWYSSNNSTTIALHLIVWLYLNRILSGRTILQIHLICILDAIHLECARIILR